MSFTGKRYDFHDQTGDYARLAEELGGLLSGENDFVANAANTAAPASGCGLDQEGKPDALGVTESIGNCFDRAAAPRRDLDV